MMAPRVEIAHLGDVAGITEIFFRCFSGEFFQDLFPPNDVGRAWHDEAWESFILFKDHGGQNAQVLVTRTPEGIVTAASLVWTIRPEHLPQDNDVRPWRERWPEARKGQDKETLKEFFTGMADQHDTIMGKRPHIYLELVFVDPFHHRQGHASALLQYASNLADALGYASYLDADQDVVPLYVKHGYVACSDVQPTSPMLAMLRPPKRVPSA